MKPIKKKIIIKITKQHPINFWRIIKSTYPDFYIKINKECLGKNFSEKLFRYLYGNKICQRKNCINTTKYINFSRGYRDFCCNRCAQLSEVVQNKIKKHNKEKWGVEYTLQNKKIREKGKKTKKEKYGNENYNNSEKAKITSQKNWGVPNPSQSTIIKEKKKKTTLKNYGVENPSQSNIIKKKKIQTTLKNYGVSNPSQSEIVKKTKEKTNLQKYGFKSAMKNDKIKNISKNRLIDEFYKKLFTSNRLNNLFTPLFSINDYTGIKHKYKFKCKKCGYIFSDHLNNGRIPRCFKCRPRNTNTSKGEKEILSYIKSILPDDESILTNTRSIIKNNELDIYLPKRKLAIEFDGLYWHSELNGKDKYYHLNKTLECEKQGIQLIHVFEDEWINKQEIVKNKFKNILGLSVKGIFIKQCEIKKISTQQKNEFLNQYHIQGSDNSSIKLGIFHQNKLISVMTFNNTENGVYELTRYASSINIIDGESKLFEYFIKNYNPVKVTGYADRRWFCHENNLYEKLNFIRVNSSQPNYWYITNFQERKQKNILDEQKNFDPNLTEWENMQISGYDRIWDCGSFEFLYFLRND